MLKMLKKKNNLFKKRIAANLVKIIQPKKYYDLV